VSEKVADDLGRMSSSAEEIGYFYIAGDQLLEEKLGEGRVHSDNFPWLEILAPMDLYKSTTSENLEFLLAFEPESELRRFIFEGQRQFSVGEGEALTTFSKAIELEPENQFLKEFYSIILTEEARKDLERKDYLKAEERLTESIELMPSNYFIYRLLGEVYLEQGQVEAAFENFSKAIEIYAYDVKSHVLLGVIYGMRGEAKEAEQKFLKAIEIDFENTLAWNNLGKLYWDQGKKEEAKKAWQESLKIDARQSDVRKAILEIK
jgi:tetratricopeptide (TPR) repeat protein